MQFLEITIRNWFCFLDEYFTIKVKILENRKTFNLKIIFTSQLKEIDKSVPHEYFSHHPSGLRIKSKKIKFKFRNKYLESNLCEHFETLFYE